MQNNESMTINYEDIYTFFYKAPIQIEQLPKEASLRTYYRIFFKNSPTIILCEDPNFKGFPYDFIDIGKYLYQNSIRVPKILNFDSNKNWIFTSDEGRLDLTSISDKTELSKRIEESMDILLKIHRLYPTSSIQRRSFDIKKFQFELDFLLTHYQQFQKDKKIDIQFTDQLYKILLHNSETLSAYPSKVVCHRDYHSRNILLNYDTTLSIVDFQDMMMGTPQYDLVSLIYDAYQPMSLEERENYYTIFYKNSYHRRDNFRDYYLRQAMQRTFKALGSYFMLFHHRGYQKYGVSILSALDNILEIHSIGKFNDEIKIFAQNLKSQISGIIQSK